MQPTINVRTQLYTNDAARNWLAIWDCLLSPTGIGDLEIVFPNERLKLEFCLRFSEYVCAQSTT